MKPPSTSSSLGYLKIFLFIYIIILLNILTTNCVLGVTTNDAKQESSLRMVQILHRHGERNPLGSLGPLYPNESDQFVRGWGQLTKKGEKQTFELGRYLRHRYDGYLDKVYRPDEIYVLSSDMDRTIQSAISVLRGLYPSVDDSDGSAQLVPIRTVDNEMDNILHFSMKCPKFKDLTTKILTQSKAIKQLETETGHLLQEVNRVTGRKAKAWAELIYLMDYVQVLIHQEKSLPIWLSDEMLGLFKKFMSHIVRKSFDSPDLRRLRSPIVQKILSTMQSKVDGDETSKKMTIYSCHDLTLLAVLAVLGFKDIDSMPPYASSLIFELHQKPQSTDYIVELFYRNTTASIQSKNEEDDETPLKLEIPNCGSPCFLHRLQPLMTPLYIENYQEACTLVSDTLSKFSAKEDKTMETCSSCSDTGDGDCTSTI